MQPYVGQTVHYVARGSADGRFPSVCRAATVTEVGAWATTDTEPGPDGRTRVVHQRWNENAVGLVVHNPTGQFFHPAADGGVDRDWGWTEPNPAGAHCPDRGRTFPGGTWHHLETTEA